MHARTVLLKAILCMVVSSSTFNLLPHLPSMSTAMRKQHSILDHQPNKKNIIIFVHGTLFSHCFFRLFSKNELEQKPAGRIAQIFSAATQDNNTFFYYYQWSGLLTENARLNAGQDLFYRLQELPKDASITIITHSHGGNVVLHCANYAQRKVGLELSIDRLILLGCPVQSHTSKHISSHFFKKIYAFHSLDDHLQEWDPQFTHGIVQLLRGKQSSFFSKRLFTTHDNVHQIQIVGQHKRFGHFDFISSEFLKAMPAIIQNIEHTATKHSGVIQHTF